MTSIRSPRSNPMTLFALVIIFMIAATRIINIDNASLWIDEGFTYYTFKADFFTTIISDRHPPLYFMSLHLWENLAGDSILALRFWSFLPSMVSVAVIYQIGRELARYRPKNVRYGVFGIPVVAALMMALMDGEHYLAQELRMYTWQVLWCALSIWMYLRWSRLADKWSAGFWILFMLSAIYTHYFSAYVIVAMGLHALLFLPMRRKLHAIGLFTIVGLCFLPWFLIVMREQFFERDVCLTCGESMGFDRLLEFRLSWFGEQWAFMMLLALFGLVVVRHDFNRRDGFETRPLSKVISTTFLIASLVIVPLLLTFIVSHRQLEFFNHHLAQLTIPIVLLLALGLSNIRPPARVVLIGAILLYGVSHVDWYRQKAPWQELVAQFAPYVEPDELVLGEIGAEEAALVYYFDHMLPAGVQISAYPWWGELSRFDYYETILPQEIAEQPSRQTRDVITAWFVYWNADTTMRGYLEQNGFVPTMTVSVEHVGNTLPAYRYDILPATPITTFDNGMVLRAVEIDPADLRVDLWWSTDAQLTSDYVTSVLVFDQNGTVVAQRDSVPFMGERSALAWGLDESVFDPKWLELTEGLRALPAGEYTIEVQVYHFVNGAIENSPTEDGDMRIIVGTLTP